MCIQFAKVTQFIVMTKKKKNKKASKIGLKGKATPIFSKIRKKFCF